MNKSLLPLTRLVLATTAVVLAIFGLSWLVSPAFTNSFLSGAPFEPIPTFWLRYDAALYLALALGAAYAFRQNQWSAARVVLAITGPYIAANVVITLASALTTGVPLIFWAYFVLAIIYLPLVIIIWRQESARSV